MSTAGSIRGGRLTRLSYLLFFPSPHPHTHTNTHTHTQMHTHSHHALEHEATAESSAIQQRLEVTESLLAERERELTEAREKITSLSEELVISERNVSVWVCTL